jgi:hypothetical protein
MKLAVRHATVLVALLGCACGSSPTQPVPPIQASSTPNPQPSPSPSPTPVPSPTPAVLSCTLPNNEPDNTTCTERNGPNGAFYNEVSNAIEEAIKEKPEYFNPTNVGIEIRQPEKYMQLVETLLNEMYGLCTHRRGDEIWIKNSQKFNDNYDLLASGKDGKQYVFKSYTVTCIPAF